MRLRKLAALLLFLFALSGAALARAAAPVYVIKVEGTVWGPQTRFIEEAIAEARKNKASAIVFEINTLGGLVTSANETKDLILDIEDMRTVAWVHHRAISAGALIALSAQKLAISPGSTIGAAAVRTSDGEKVEDPKVISYWRKEFASTAQARGRNPEIAMAFVSAEKAIPALNVKENGILTLRDDEALRVGFADFEASSIADVLKGMHLPAGSPIVVPRQDTLWESASRIIVLPWVTITLLVIGCVLLFIELLTLHTWGLMGTLGALAVAAVFAANITLGEAGWIGVVLFLAGLTFLLLETHVFPGFGISGVAGLLLLFGGMFWSLGGSQNAVLAVSVSALLTIAIIVGFFAYLPRSPVWKTLGQQMQQRSSMGYVTSESLAHFLGRTGKAATVLRPSGMADIDGVRLDVITEGEFIEPGTPVVVIKVEGARVVVDQLENAVADADSTEEPSRAA